MSSVNKVILVGNVGKNPEVKELTNGKVANMAMATSERYKDKNGDRQEKTEWHNIVVYGKLVDIVEKYVKKGDKLYIEGSITTRKWQDKEGNDRYTTEVKAFNMTMLGGTEKKSTQPAAVAADVEDDLPF
jgi:single-strand DNA-binding protein